MLYSIDATPNRLLISASRKPYWKRVGILIGVCAAWWLLVWWVLVPLIQHRWPTDGGMILMALYFLPVFASRMISREVSGAIWPPRISLRKNGDGISLGRSRLKREQLLTVRLTRAARGQTALWLRIAVMAGQADVDFQIISCDGLEQAQELAGTISRFLEVPIASS